MYLLRTIAFLAIITFIPVGALAFEGPAGCGSMDCGSCHELSIEDANKLVSQLGLKVTEVKQSPVKGVWEIKGSQNGKNVMTHIDFGEKYLLDIRQFISFDQMNNPPKPKKLDRSKIPLTGSVLMGDEKAKNKIIVFDDPDCPYCRKLHKDIKEIIAKRKDIAFYIKLFPLAMHPEAYKKSQSVLCEKSMELLDAAFEGKEVPPAKCKTSEVDDNIELAKSLGISGTPGIILPNGTLIAGYVKADKLIQLIDENQK